MTTSTTAAVRGQILSVLAADDRVLFAYVFGSTATGTASDTSDVDIALYPRAQLGLIDQAELEERLARALGRDVDLVMLDGAPLWLQYRVLGEGRVVFSRDERARITFRAHVEKSFLDFRPFHEAYLDATRQRARRGVLSLG